MDTNNDLKLTEQNYYPEITKKLRVIIGNIPNNNLTFFDGWKTRYNGNYKRTCHYTIDRNGIIYSHFPTDTKKSWLNELFDSFLK